jgi:hypothetical protein
MGPAILEMTRSAAGSPFSFAVWGVIRCRHILEIFEVIHDTSPSSMLELRTRDLLYLTRSS